jgi:hypothetical protein
MVLGYMVTHDGELPYNLSCQSNKYLTNVILHIIIVFRFAPYVM